MNNRTMPCRITDEHVFNPWNHDDEDTDREDRINARVDEMAGDLDYLADAMSELPSIIAVQTTLAMVNRHKTVQGERMARDVGMENLIIAVRNALRPIAEAEIDANPIDHELNQADQLREG